MSRGSIVFAKGLVVPVSGLRLAEGAIKVESTVLAGDLTGQFPSAWDLSGAWDILDPGGLLYCTGWTDRYIVGPITDAEESITITVTLTVDHNKKTSSWLTRIPKYSKRQIVSKFL